MSKVTKAIALVLLGLSLIYLYTRVSSLQEMRLSSAYIGESYGGYNPSKSRFDNIEGLHFFLIGHSLACVFISVFAFLTVRKSLVIDRRQYFVMVAVSTLATLIYMIAFIYIVATGTSNFMHSTSNYTSPTIVFLEGILELLSTISRTPFAYFFAVVMNFVLLYGIFVINMCSLYLMEIAKTLE